ELKCIWPQQVCAVGKSTVTPSRSSTVTVARPTWGNNVSLKHVTKRATRTVVASHCQPGTSTTDIGGLAGNKSGQAALEAEHRQPLRAPHPVPVQPAQPVDHRRYVP